MSYFPLDRDLLTSSTWATGNPKRIKVWIYLLLAANPRNGIVDDADPGIALRCGLSLEATSAALDWLAAPDPHSRTKNHEGRRIKRLQTGGILVLNYTRRRDKDYSTPRWREWKERKKANAPTPANGVGNDGKGNGHGQREIREGRGEAASTHPSRSKPSLTDETATAIEALARETSEVLNGGIDTVSLIRQASTIPASGRYSEKAFSNPRRKGISEEWGKATLAKLKDLRSIAWRRSNPPL